MKMNSTSMPAFVRRVDELTEFAISALREALDLAASRRLVVVCDPLKDDTFLVRANELHLHTRTIQLMTVAQRQGPVLIEIPDESGSESFINDSLRTAVTQALQPARWDQRIRSVCAWLITEKPLSELVQIITRHAHFLDAEGVRRTCRVWDPRTMQHAHEFCGSGQPHSGVPDTHWGMVDSFGQWQLLPPASSTATWAIPVPARLRELCLMNAALQRLTAQGMDRQPAIWSTLQNSIRVAGQCGLIDDDDVIWFASDRVRLRAPLEQAGAWQRLFPAIKQGKARYVRATADYDDDAWQSVLATITDARPSQGDV